MRPLLRQAEVVTTPGAVWTPCEMIAWHKLVEPRRQNPHRWVEWLGEIQLDGDEAWYEFSGVRLRPVLERGAEAIDRIFKPGK